MWFLWKGKELSGSGGKDTSSSSRLSKVLKPFEILPFDK
jgi:hypothetical protein